MAQVEFFINAVRYSPSGPIALVRADRYVNGAKLSTYEFTPHDVVNYLRSGFLFYTETRGRKGAEVRVTDDGRFITTTPNGWVYDNLESLPRF